jgi:NADPH:quinone reductase-like Zn-dependent oxidoreductase
MRAIVQDIYGSPDVLELREVDKPVPGDDEALLRVRAGSVNPADWHAMRGSPFVVRLAGYGLRKPKNPIPTNHLPATPWPVVSTGAWSFA